MKGTLQIKKYMEKYAKIRKAVYNATIVMKIEGLAPLVSDTLAKFHILQINVVVKVEICLR